MLPKSTNHSVCVLDVIKQLNYPTSLPYKSLNYINKKKQNKNGTFHKNTINRVENTRLTGDLLKVSLKAQQQCNKRLCGRSLQGALALKTEQMIKNNGHKISTRCPSLNKDTLCNPRHGYVLIVYFFPI